MTDVQFTTRDLPWMKLGAQIDNAVTSAEAAKMGGLDFEIELMPIGWKQSAKPKVGKSPWNEISNRRAVVRKDTQELLYVPVSADYKPVQYAEAFEFMDSISPTYVAAGALHDNRVGFMVATLPGLEKLNLEILGEEDPHDLYIVLRTSHDKSMAVELAVMPLRQRCMNQMTLPSFTRGTSQRWSIRHTGNPQAKLAAAQSTILRVGDYVDEYTATAERLARVELEIDEVKDLLTDILPDSKNQSKYVQAIVGAWQESPTVGFPGTGWGLVNAVGEYFEHGRGHHTPNSRLRTGLDGSAHRVLGRTAQVLLSR